MRGPFRGKRLLTTILVVPVTLGTVLIAEGLLRYLGPRGWFNRTLIELGPDRRADPARAQLLGRAVLADHHGLPVRVPADPRYLSGIDPTLERAAATLGAGPWQRFRRITLPLLAPGLATTVLPYFVLAFAVFPSASLVGEPSGSTRVISIAAYHAAFEEYDYSMGSAIAMIMGAVELAVIGLLLFGRSRLYSGPTREARDEPRRSSARPGAWLVWGASASSSSTSSG